jgi:hypothetical protein
MPEHLEKLDDKPIDTGIGEVLCFAGIRNEIDRFPRFLEHYRSIGVNRFFILDNGSNDGTRDYVISQPDCHCFHTEGSHFAKNVEPPNWVNTLLRVHGIDHWCISVDGDELFVYPDYETIRVSQLCKFLDETGVDALSAAMIDMYGNGPIAQARYHTDKSFLEQNPYFDRTPGWLRPNDGGYPPIQMFGGVRERTFWRSKHRLKYPPCITKVPLVKWKRGTQYKIAQHVITPVILSDLHAGLLHFKFLTGFVSKTRSSVEENEKVQERGLNERAVYMAVLKENPSLSFMSDLSIKYTGSAQLTKLGWMRSSVQYKRFVDSCQLTQ